MARIIWTEEAAIWLEEIYRYLTQDNPEAACRTIRAIYDKAQILKDFPLIGHKYRAEPEGEIRILLYGHYRIAYLIHGNERVDIMGVFHAALDFDRYL